TRPWLMLDCSRFEKPAWHGCQSEARAKGVHVDPFSFSSSQFSRRRALSLAAGAAALAARPTGLRAFAEVDLGTIESGKLTVAFNGDLPMTSLQDGEIVGMDGEMISLIAGKLGLE